MNPHLKQILAYTVMEELNIHKSVYELDNTLSIEVGETEIVLVNKETREPISLASFSITPHNANNDVPYLTKDFVNKLISKNTVFLNLDSVQPINEGEEPILVSSYLMSINRVPIVAITDDKYLQMNSLATEIIKSVVTLAEPLSTVLPNLTNDYLPISGNRILELDFFNSLVTNEIMVVSPDNYKLDGHNKYLDFVKEEILAMVLGTSKVEFKGEPVPVAYLDETNGTIKADMQFYNMHRINLAKEFISGKKVKLNKL